MKWLSAIERRAAMAVFRWLVHRGWIVQLNTPDRCHDTYTAEGGVTRDRGWTPFHSVRYGRTPVYRGVGEVRWRG